MKTIWGTVFAFLLGSICAVAHAAPAPWESFVLDQSTETRLDSQLVIDNHNGAHVLYRTEGSGLLKYAHYDGREWTVEQLDSAVEEMSLAVDSAGRARVAYVKGTGALAMLLFMERLGNPWTRTLIAMSVHRPSLMLDANDVPHVVFNQNGLRYGVRPARDWQIETLDCQPLQNLDWTDQKLSLDVAGHPHIAIASSDGLLYLLKDSGGWHSSQAPRNFDWSNPRISLALDSQSRAHIALLDDAQETLLYFSTDGRSWNEERVGWNRGASEILIAPHDQPIISAYQINGDDGSNGYWTRQSSNTWNEHPIEEHAAEPLAMALDASGDLHFTYALASGGSSRLTYLRPLRLSTSAPTTRTNQPTADAAFMLGDVYVYPNPARGPEHPIIHIEAGRADEVTIHIFDVSGHKVADLDSSQSPTVFSSRDGVKMAYEIPWDAGAASGIYYFSADVTKQGKPPLHATGRFAIVR